MQNKKIKAQVWVETAIYTVIGLAVIAILLSVVTPQIEKAKDKGIIEQTIVAMDKIDGKISEAEQASGSIRIVDLRIAKGKIEIDSENDKIVYVLENTKLELSEPGEEVREGDIFIKTEKVGSRFNIILELRYENIDITFDGLNDKKVLNAGTTPYKIQIENIGNPGVVGKVRLDFGLL